MVPRNARIVMVREREEKSVAPAMVSGIKAQCVLTVMEIVTLAAFHATLAKEKGLYGNVAPAAGESDISRDFASAV